MNFSGEFGTDQTIWYPATGSRKYDDGSLSYVGTDGDYWSATPGGRYAYALNFNDGDEVLPSLSYSRAFGNSVRCLQE